MGKHTMIDFALDELNVLFDNLEEGAILCGREYAKKRLPELWEELISSPEGTNPWIISDCRERFATIIGVEAGNWIGGDNKDLPKKMLSIAGLNDVYWENAFHRACLKLLINKICFAAQEYVWEWFDQYQDDNSFNFNFPIGREYIKTRFLKQTKR